MCYPQYIALNPKHLRTPLIGIIRRATDVQFAARKKNRKVSV